MENTGPKYHGVKIDRVIRSRRRTIALIVQNDGKLVVRAPWGVTENQIQNIVDRKVKWIINKQVLSREKQQRIQKQYINGEKFLYLGYPYRLAIVDSPRPALTLEKQFLLARTSHSKARQVFTRWYKEQAMQVITSRVHFFIERLGVSCPIIRITSARTRWGSCSFKGTLSFTWRLVMAPLDIIDYVVLHELVHLKHKNHSKAFWLNVQAYMPDFNERRKWLKENGYLLSLDPA